MAALILLAALLDSSAAMRLETETVQIVDVNHVHDGDTGRETMTQLVYLDDDWTGKARIIAWRLNKSPGMIPTGRGPYRHAIWFDGERLMRVRCRTVTRSWATHDYELLSREAWPVERRRELLGK